MAAYLNSSTVASIPSDGDCGRWRSDDGGSTASAAETLCLSRIRRTPWRVEHLCFAKVSKAASVESLHSIRPGIVCRSMSGQFSQMTSATHRCLQTF